MMTAAVKTEKKVTKTVKSSNLKETLARMVKSPSAKVGWIMFFAIVIACIGAPIWAPYGPNDIDLTNMLATPSAEHILGCDAIGRDIFSRLLYGGRYSLSLGLVTSLVGAFIGIAIGCIAGYFGGKVENLIMRFMDIWSALPSMLLCILLSQALGAGFFNTVLALTVGGVPGSVRMTRAMILAERSKEYLEAAESINCHKLVIMFKHLVPNTISPSLVSLTMGIGNTIIMSSSLSYIGLGVQPPTPEWGAMLSDGRQHILKYPHLIMFPGLIIALTVLAINLLGDGVRDALDPKLRS